MKPLRGESNFTPVQTYYFVAFRVEGTKVYGFKKSYTGNKK